MKIAFQSYNSFIAAGRVSSLFPSKCCKDGDKRRIPRVALIPRDPFFASVTAIDTSAVTDI